MDDESTHITVKANEPFKLLFIDLDIGMVAGLIAMSGFLAQSYILPTIAAAAVGYGLHYIRTNYPRGFMTQFILYWTLPSPFRPLKATPPSAIREFIG
jgi:type IV conjugative transfer system protein TraL